jgi:hypothetical protein
VALAGALQVNVADVRIAAVLKKARAAVSPVSGGGAADEAASAEGSGAVGQQQQQQQAAGQQQQQAAAGQGAGVAVSVIVLCDGDAAAAVLQERLGGRAFAAGLAGRLLAQHVALGPTGLQVRRWSVSLCSRSVL